MGVNLQTVFDVFLIQKILIKTEEILKRDFFVCKTRALSFFKSICELQFI